MTAGDFRLPFERHRRYARSMSQVARVRAEALSLPEEERIALATELLDSVGADPDEAWSQAWGIECQRRVELAARRGTKAPAGADVLARLRSRFDR